MNSYKCKVCQHIYSPQEGDPQHGIEPNTPFEQLPDDWKCPICGVGKESFTKIEK
ncbi:MAG: rubredoxin [Rikenellaceae bacterium]